MSEFFKKFKNVFVETDEEDQSKEIEKVSRTVKKTITPKQEKAKPISDPTISLNTISEKNQTKVSVKFTKKLLEALERSDQEGFDYLEFKSTLNSLKSMSMDETTKFKSAEAMAKAMGVTTKSILESANYYLKVLASEEQLFEEALNNQYRKNVVGKEKYIEQLNGDVNTMKEQIEALNEKIKEIQGKIDETRGELESSKEKMNETKTEFISAYTNMTTQIKSDCQKIKKHLGE